MGQVWEDHWMKAMEAGAAGAALMEAISVRLDVSMPLRLNQ